MSGLVERAWRGMLVAGAAAVLSSMLGCSSSSSTTPQTIEVVPPPVPALTTPISVRVVDAATGAAVTAQVTITPTGPGASAISNGTATAGGSLTTTAGAAAVFGTSRAPSTGAPIDVTFRASAAGFVAGAERLVLTAPGEAQATVALIRVVADVNGNITSLPAGSTGAVVTTPAVPATGVPPAPITVGSAPTGGTTQVTLPTTVAVGSVVAGTFRPAAPGVLRSTIISYGVTEQSAAALPGGAQAAVAGAAADTTLLPLGLAEIGLTDSAGAAVNTFRSAANPAQPGSIDVVSQIPASSLKADGTPYVAGDAIDVFTFDDAAGSWSLVANAGGVILSQSGDSLNVRYTVSSLSPKAVGRTRSTCSSTVNLVGRGSDTRSLSVRVSGFRYSETVSTSGSSVSLRVPTGNATITVRDAATGATVGSSSDVNPCGNPSVTISLPTTPVGSLALTSVEQCASGTNRRNVPLTYSVLIGGNLVTSGYSGTGSVTLPGLAAGSYSVIANYRANVANAQQQQLVQTGSVTANATAAVTFQFDAQCTVVTGTGGG